jgi:hypothetical protein
METTQTKKREAAPLCKFGPGGDFVSVWQPETPGPCEQSNYLKKLSISIFEVAAILLGFKLTKPLNLLINASGSPALHNNEEMKNAFKFNRVHRTTNPAPTPVAQDDSRLPSEPMLFPDFGRNGIRIRHQPKHRIRTYRRTAKKRPAMRFAKQSTLFEDKFKCARIA